MSGGTGHRGRGGLAVFGAPVAIGVASAAGLLGALLYGEAGKVLSWITLSVPLAVCVVAYWRSR